MTDASPRGRGELVLLWLTIAVVAGSLVALPFAVASRFDLEPPWIVLVGGLTAVGAAAWEAVATKRLRAWHVLAFAGGLIAIGGGFWQGIRAEKREKDGYCMWMISGDLNTGKMHTRFMNPTDYPAFDCKITIRELLEPDGVSERILFSSDLGIIPPHTVTLMELPIDLGPGNRRCFVVDIAMQDYLYFQQVYFRRVDGRWRIANRVEGGTSASKLVYENIDPKFPRDTKGQPDFR